MPTPNPLVDMIALQTILAVGAAPIQPGDRFDATLNAARRLKMEGKAKPGSASAILALGGT